ncbi:MAG: AbrB/MazE/SpoVT family DNA-binding domain-containing protein [Candidatus Limnocylindria bacterium]
MSDTYVVEVGPKGRVVIPAALRRRLGLDTGSQLVAMEERGAVVLLPRSEVKARLRGMLAGAGVSLAEELARERRADAKAESAP